MRYLVAIGLSVALWSIACTRGPKGLSRGTYAAIEKGLPPLERAYEYRDANATAFEPRMLNAEHALDEVLAAGSKNANDASAWLIFRLVSNGNSSGYRSSAGLSTSERSIFSPSFMPSTSSLARSGCGIIPRTLRPSLQMPAMFSSDPLGFASSVSSPCGVA